MSELITIELRQAIENPFNNEKVNEIAVQAQKIIASAGSNSADSRRTMLRIRELFNKAKNPEHWKLPIKTLTTDNPTYAAEMVAAIVFYVGGAVVVESMGKIYIGSQGYYHYIGA